MTVLWVDKNQDLGFGFSKRNESNASLKVESNFRSGEGDSLLPATPQARLRNWWMSDFSMTVVGKRKETTTKRDTEVWLRLDEREEKNKKEPFDLLFCGLWINMMFFMKLRSIGSSFHVLINPLAICGVIIEEDQIYPHGKTVGHET